jgi:type IV pilus assembly protein PilB
VNGTSVDVHQAHRHSGDGTSVSERKLIGELLVEAKALTRAQLDEALKAPRDSGKRLGQVLIDRGLVTEAQVTQALSLQLGIPWVSLYHVDFSRQLLNRVPRELAEKHCLVPIFVRHVKGHGDTLYIATDDPKNDVALVEVSRAAGLPTRPMIASPSDIRSAIRVYYSGSTETPTPGSPASSAVAPPPPLPPVTTEAKRPDKPGPPPLPPRTRAPMKTLPDGAPPPTSGGIPSTTPASGTHSAPPPSGQGIPPTPQAGQGIPPTPQARQGSTMGAASGAGAPTPDAQAAKAPSSAPPPPNAEISAEMDDGAGIDGAVASLREREGRLKEGPRMVALTLLDGTEISLPAQPKRTSNSPPPPSFHEHLTARDLISALRAHSHGADASEILGEQVQWEPVFAAILAVLLRKGLIADWEFVEELRKT